MHHSRTLVPILGLTALSAAILPAAPARAQTVTVTVTNLSPARTVQSSASGVSGGQQVGFAAGSHFHAFLWSGSAGSAVDLNPGFLFNTSFATDTTGSTQVGYGYNDSQDNPIHALLWTGTANSAVDLNPAGFTSSEAFGVDGNTQVGTGFNGSVISESNHALLWHGTPESVVDLSPAGFTATVADAVSGSNQVGSGRGVADGGYEHALLWHGTANSVVDLNPFPSTNCQGIGVFGDTEVGSAEVPYDHFNQHAFLWHGTAQSGVDLHPAGYGFSLAYAVAGDVQVGTGRRTKGGVRALLWRGTPGSVVDLTSYLPAAFHTSSGANSVSGSGNVYDVVGYGADSNNSPHAFLWHVVFAASGKPVLSDLNPGSRTEGREGFTLTVSGTGFTSKSEVQWNGAAQPTTFVNGTTLKASISAPLIAQAGTAKITVVTPGVGTSNARTEVIMARPTLSALSPASKKAGSGAFTLTVTGANFRPASFYAPTIVKWNGTVLATTFVSSTQITAQVPASLLTTSGTAAVTVTTPQVATAAGKTFTITP